MEMLTSITGKKLDLVDKLYQESIFPSAFRVASGERLEVPLVVDLDPTTFCDLSCPECISKLIINNGQLAKDRLETLAAELAASSVKAVILIGGGEPLMHKSIGTVIPTLGNAGIQIGLVTNGTLIHRYLREISDYVSWTRVSLDAATVETHNIFRPGGRSVPVFPQIMANMMALAKSKRGKLGYSFLLMYRTGGQGQAPASNYHELAAAGKLAKQIGCDYFEVKAFFDEGHFIMQIPQELRATLYEQMAELQELEEENFQVLESSTVQSLLHGEPRVKPKEYSRCLTTELRTTITPSGVYVCPYHRGNKNARIGDIANESLVEMWRKADTGIVNPSEQCRFHCARHETNCELALMGQKLQARSLVEDYDFFI